VRLGKVVSADRSQNPAARMENVLRSFIARFFNDNKQRDYHTSRSRSCAIIRRPRMVAAAIIVGQLSPGRLSPVLR
jgi:hypothetical protein